MLGFWGFFFFGIDFFLEWSGVGVDVGGVVRGGVCRGGFV